MGKSNHSSHPFFTITPNKASFLDAVCNIKCNLLFDWVYELSTFPLLLDIISELIGPNLLLTNSIFRIKEPLSSTHYGWHQDAARIQVNPAFVIVYVAISDATTENGCLRVIPGSNEQIEPFHLTSYAERQVARVSHVDDNFPLHIS